jgi:hypothetical protein
MVDRMQPRFHESLEPHRAGGESTSGTSDGRQIVYHNPAAESKDCRLTPAHPRTRSAVVHGIAGRLSGGACRPSHHGFEPSCRAPGRGRDVQSPVPGLAEKWASSFPETPSHSFASAGASFFWVMFGQLLA